MNVDRTIKLKLELSDENKETLRKTMVLSNQVFNEIARYGFENHTCSKVSVHHATYYGIREKHPELPCSILQGIRDVACESLKGVELKKLPVSKPFSAIRYNKRVHRINILKQNVSLSSIKGNRKSHSFKCVKCGFQIHADLNAARNIADIGKSDIGRLTVTQPYIACDEVEARKGIDTEHSDNRSAL